MDEFFEQAYQEENTVTDETPELEEQQTPIGDDSTSTEDVVPQEDIQAEPQTIETESIAQTQTIMIDGKAVSLEELQQIYKQQVEQSQPNEVPGAHTDYTKQHTGYPDNPLEQRLVELEQRLADKELEEKLHTLKEKYPDFDETKVLRTAYEKGITDLEFVYKSTREFQAPDVDAIKAQLRAEIMQELSATRAETGTIVSHGSAPLQASTPKLTEQERLMAEEFGLTEEEYINYR